MKYQQIKQFYEELISEIPKTRRTAASRIGENAKKLGDHINETITHLLKCLKNENDPSVQSEILWALGELGAEDINQQEMSCRELTSILRNKKWPEETRISAANALGRCGINETTKQLELIIRDTNESDSVVFASLAAYDEIDSRIRDTEGPEISQSRGAIRTRGVSSKKVDQNRRKEFIELISKTFPIPTIRTRGAIAMKKYKVQE